MHAPFYHHPVLISAEPSTRLLRAACIFGLPIKSPAIHNTTSNTAAHTNTTPPGITLIAGPSGAGKSTHLRAMAACHAQRGHPVIAASSPTGRTPLIDRVGTDTRSALAVLAAAGLADATLLARTPDQLSEGERTRMGVAVAIDAALRAASNANDASPILVVADEFCSALDRLTAAGVAGSIHRWLRRLPNDRVRFVAVTAHEDMPRLLAPDTLVRIEHGVASVHTVTAKPPTHGCSITPGDITDYDHLARYHYLGGRPGTHQTVLKALHRKTGTLAGVLVVSPPTRCGAWRAHAWPGRYATANTAGLRTLNAELRRITRVVVDPRFRGLGLAADLVRAYLNDPITPATEAVAAMGSASPFFERAGMTAYPLPLAPADQRLADALAASDIDHTDLLRPATLPPLVNRELARWFEARRAALPSATRRSIENANTDTPLRTAAAFRLAGASVAYAHTIPDRTRPCGVRCRARANRTGRAETGQTD